ncbi:hypothetical protein MCEMIE22_02352 [Mycobacteriaceae bacterium]
MDSAHLDNRMCTGQPRRRAAAGLGALIALTLLTAPGAGADAVDPAEPSSPAAVETAPAATPHLPSPENLPPGTTQTAPERRTLGYLRDIWNSVRTEDVTMSDMLFLIAQRPMTAAPPAAPSPVTAPVSEGQ